MFFSENCFDVGCLRMSNISRQFLGVFIPLLWKDIDIAGPAASAPPYLHPVFIVFSCRSGLTHTLGSGDRSHLTS